MKKKMMMSHIDSKGNDGFDWSISVNNAIIHHDKDMDDFTDGCLYTDEQYGYYERTYTICSDHYCSTYRFDKERMRDVLLYLADTPLNLERFLLSIGGEIINQERY